MVGEYNQQIQEESKGEVMSSKNIDDFDEVIKRINTNMKQMGCLLERIVMNLKEKNANLEHCVDRLRKYGERDRAEIERLKEELSKKE